MTAKLNCEIPQGASYFIPCHAVDPDRVAIDISGMLVRGKIRATQSTTGTLIANFIGYVIDGPNGLAIAMLDPTSITESAIPATSVFMTIEAYTEDNLVVIRLVEGEVAITKTVAQGS